jgi:hypothetical protein
MTRGAHGVSWGAYGAQNPSPASIRQHSASENDIDVICIPAGQIAFDPAPEWRPQQDSNLRSRLRRPLLSPLSYGGLRDTKEYQPQAAARTSL